MGLIFLPKDYGWYKLKSNSKNYGFKFLFWTYEFKLEAINDNYSDIRKYGGINQAEFFAVVTEYFFECPDLLKEKHPELYLMLVQCFKQKLGE